MCMPTLCSTGPSSPLKLAHAQCCGSLASQMGLLAPPVVLVVLHRPSRILLRAGQVQGRVGRWSTLCGGAHMPQQHAGAWAGPP